MRFPSPSPRATDGNGVCHLATSESNLPTLLQPSDVGGEMNRVPAPGQLRGFIDTGRPRFRKERASLRVPHRSWLSTSVPSWAQALVDVPVV